MRKSLPIFYNALLLTAVNLLLRFVSTSFQVHISGRIGAEGVGLLQLVMSVGGLALTAGMAGIRTATMYLTAEELGRNNRQNITRILRGCFVYSITCSGIVSLVVYFAAPAIASHWIGHPNTVDAVRLYAKFLPLICLTGCMTGYFTAANRITMLAGVEILEQLCYMVVTMALLQFCTHRDPYRACEAVVMGCGISSCVTLLCLLYLRHQENTPKGSPLRLSGRLIRTAVPLGLADDLKVGITTAENLMVPQRLALYAGANNPLASFGTVTGMVFPVLMFPAAILYALAELLIPELARCNARDSRIRIRYLTKKSLRLALLYGCLCGGCLFLIARPLCMALCQSQEAGIYLQLYSLLAPMLYCDAITDAMVKGLGQQTASVRYNILTSAMDVAGLYLLLPCLGMKGYYISFFLSHLVNFVLSLRRLLKVSGVRITLRKPIYVLCSLFLGILAAQHLRNTAARLSAFLAAIAASLWLFGVISRYDWLWLRNLIYKKPVRKEHSGQVR